MPSPLRVISSKLESLVMRLDLRLKKPTGQMASAMKSASTIYMGFIRRRFVNESKGQMDWPDLAPSTKLGRMRKTKRGKAALARNRKKLNKANVTGALTVSQRTDALLAGQHFDILRDTGLMLNSLSDGSPGFVREDVDYGIYVGTADKKAKFHQKGGPHLPKREIIVLPDDNTLNMMTKVLAPGFRSVVKEAADGAS